MKLKNALSDIRHLIYPSICLICDKELSRNENHICTFCTMELPVTNFHSFEDETPMDKLFWGRIKVFSTYAHLFFEKGKGSQRILFNLKYKNNRSIGEHFGREIGIKLQNSPLFETAETIIPVPLHYKKEFIRGFNQSEILSNGLSEILGIPVDTQTIQRSKHTQSQTQKSRFQRWDNVESIFTIKNKIKEYKHIIIVDDVITTGSTLESIIKEIQVIHSDIKVSVVTLAIA